MRGELWQECRRSGCETEPVCASCEYCRRHCNCPREKNDEEMEAEVAAAAQAAQVEAAARAALIERFSSEDADPLEAPIEYGVSTGFKLLTPEARGRFLDMVLEREEWYAPRMKREPMTTRLEVVRMLAAGAKIPYSGDWYAELRMGGEGTK